MRRTALAMLVGSLVLLQSEGTSLAGNPNPGVAPPNSTPGDMTYGEWGGAWWSWALGIPAASNPVIDETGEFGDVDQQGSVWFLAGTFGATAERTLSVPTGKKLFFPIINSVWWAPDDVEFAAMIAEDVLGLDPEEFTDKELIELMAVLQVTFDTLQMHCTVDGVEITNLEDYFAVSPPFPIIDTDLLDDWEVPISQPNCAIAAGYWLMLNPLKKGEHTIHFSADGQGNPVFADFALDVTYHLTVE